MTIRRDRELDVTIACAFIGRYLQSMAEYLDAKESVRRLVEESILDAGFLSARVRVNPDDHPESGSIYLTVNGVSIEQGDCGIAGRGNRANGVISPGRGMTNEAAAGKSIVNHPGKLYTLAAQEIAKQIVESLGAKEAAVTLVGSVGDQVDNPSLCYAKVIESRTVSESDVKRICSYWLDHLDLVRYKYLIGQLVVL